MENYWESEQIFLDGDEYFAHLIHDIEQATNYITVEVYMFNDDVLGKELASRLIMAQKRGVRVQIIVDGIGSYGFTNRLFKLFVESGIQVKIYHPLPFYHPFYGQLNFQRKLQTFFSRFWSINRRNHRKLVTIDSSIMYTGSFNFSAEHTHLHSGKKWKDMGVRVTGEHVQYAILHFKKIWRLRDFLKYRRQVGHLPGSKGKDSPLRLNHSLFMKRFYYRDLLKNIHKAQDHIWLMTPYFIPKRRLIRALGKAAKRGVDVRLLISSKSDVRVFQTLQFFYYPYLLRKNVKIFQFNDTILHAKNFIIDEWITVGSSNLNHRSFLHDLEVDLVIQNQKNKDIIEDNFIQCTSRQTEITIDHLKQRTLFDKFLSRLFFLFKYWF